MNKNAEMRWETVRSLRGVTALARRLGYSHTHILRVMAGERQPSDKLRRKLGKLGITTPKSPAEA